MPRSPTLPWLGFALVACGGEAHPSLEYVAPVDGQTAIPLDLPLLVYAPGLDLPPDYPVPDTVRVVDLQRGGFVDGTLVRDGFAWWFEPDGGWAPDRRYAWTFDPPPPVAHGPRFDVSASLVGSFVFDTAPTIAALAAGTGDTGAPCVVLSGPVDDDALAEAPLTVDDVAVDDPAWALLDPDQWAPDLPIRPPGDPGLSVACALGADPGAFLRLWVGDAGPWLLEISPDGPADVVAALHRRTP